MSVLILLMHLYAIDHPAKISQELPPCYEGFHSQAAVVGYRCTDGCNVHNYLGGGLWGTTLLWCGGGYTDVEKKP